jgi:hypothetical protein
MGTGVSPPPWSPETTFEHIKEQTTIYKPHRVRGHGLTL